MLGMILRGGLGTLLTKVVILREVTLISNHISCTIFLFALLYK